MDDEKELDIKVVQLRIKEKGMLGVNDIFGPPIGVRNEIMRAWLDTWEERKEQLSLGDFSEFFLNWRANELRKRGFERISEDKPFTRLSKNEWAPEYEIVPTA